MSSREPLTRRCPLISLVTHPIITTVDNESWEETTVIHHNSFELSLPSCFLDAYCKDHPYRRSFMAKAEAIGKPALYNGIVDFSAPTSEAPLRCTRILGSNVHEPSRENKQGPS